jgi:adapter protein MecA 1/2
VRIERINDNQIRCILSKRDLSERQLKISELAYGSDRAKELFRDMMEQASLDFGFDADDIPLMIEAIPTSKESIVLVITKVEDPDEFEEKFSKFGNIANKFVDEDEDEDFYDEDIEDEPDEFEDDLINCFEQLNEIIAEADDTGSEFIPLHEILKKRKRSKESSEKHTKVSQDTTSRLYSFPSLNFIISASKAVVRVYSGKNSVWKDEKTSRYYMILSKNNKMASFDKVCSILGEFGKKETLTYATQDFFNEHYKLILKDDAITKLSLL